jgi:hypothetical protein
MERSIVEATDAHLIVLPTPRNRALSLELREFFERWALARQIKDAAVAAVYDGTHGFNNPADPELSIFAQRHGLNLITERGLARRETMEPVAPPPRSHEFPLPMHLRLVEHPVTRDLFRGFGINE